MCLKHIQHVCLTSRNGERKQSFCLFTTKLHRAPSKRKPGNNLQPHRQHHHRTHTLTTKTYGCVRVRVGSWLEKKNKKPMQMLTDVLQEFGCCICHPAAPVTRADTPTDSSGERCASVIPCHRRAAVTDAAHWSGLFPLAQFATNTFFFFYS